MPLSEWRTERHARDRGSRITAPRCACYGQMVSRKIGLDFAPASAKIRSYLRFKHILDERETICLPSGSWSNTLTKRAGPQGHWSKQGQSRVWRKADDFQPRQAGGTNWAPDITDRHAKKSGIGDSFSRPLPQSPGLKAGGSQYREACKITRSQFSNPDQNGGTPHGR